MKTRFLLALAASAALAACGDFSAPAEVVYGVSVYTQPKIVPPDTQPDFTPYSSYNLDPAITVRRDGSNAQDESLDDPKWAQVKAEIIAQMDLAGYGAAPVDATPAPGKVGLKLGLINNSIDYYYTGGYCDIWYGYYGCYYPPVYAGSYRVGTVILGMVDLTTPPAVGAEFPGLWFSMMYGVLETYPAVNQAKLIQAIDRAFEQSPYLNAP